MYQGIKYLQKKKTRTPPIACHRTDYLNILCLRIATRGALKYKQIIFHAKNMWFWKPYLRYV